jgi:hypothetical protein
VVLLIGFKQNSQFDIDRWLLGFKQLKVDVAVVEVPAIRGLFPKMIKSYIDSGMRSGIPEEDWPGVVSVYSGSRKIADFTGTENILNARVLLLNSEGKVDWFHDRGYSIEKIIELKQKILET